MMLPLSAARAQLLSSICTSRRPQPLPYAVHYTIGSCGIFGVLNKNGIAPSDPQYGKKAFEDRFGPTHYSFDYKGMALRCARLDLPARRPYLDGQIGEEQIA